MSFWDFDQEGPGSYSWDYVIGGNTTGLFPEETHYVLEGDQLTEVTFSHTGGGKLEPSFYGLTYSVNNISAVNIDSKGNRFITFNQEGICYKGVLNSSFTHNDDCLIIDIVQL